MELGRRAAPAKLNLALDILGPRPDGYHEMRMVMHTVSLCDWVSLREEGEGFSLETEGGFCLPPGKKTMEQQAAESFFQAVGRPMPGLAVRLEKRIPAYAGLGGGSADTAALLRILRDTYCPDMSLEELEAVGLEVARLRRSSVGPIRLGMLQPGKWRELTPQEVRAVRGAVKGQETQPVHPREEKNFGRPAAKKKPAHPQRKEDDFSFRKGRPVHDLGEIPVGRGADKGRRSPHGQAPQGRSPRKGRG